MLTCRSLEGLKSRARPDVILTHSADAHQDHSEVSKLTWNTFRNHLILEYEIPKWDGDLGRPNLYVPVDANLLQSLPAELVAYTGADALTHALECTTCLAANNVSDALAEKAIALLFQNLARAAENVEEDEAVLNYQI